MILKFKYTSDYEYELKSSFPGEWIDLQVCEDCSLYKNEHYGLRLGIAVEPPPNHELIIAPRSSTFIKYGILLTNSIGVIDYQYRGELIASVYTTREIFIPKGARIVQFRIQEQQPNIEFMRVSDLAESERGSGGFGSTGV